MAEKRKKVLGSLQPDVEDILEWNNLPDNAFEPASAQEKESFIQDRKSVSYWKDAWRRLRHSRYPWLRASHRSEGCSQTLS